MPALSPWGAAGGYSSCINGGVPRFRRTTDVRLKASAACIIASDDECFTYNARVSRLPPIQEHKMVVRAVRNGVKPERIAAAAWHAYRASEISQRLKSGIHRLSDMLEWGDELSARHAQAGTAGTWDFVHVAAAQHARPEVFITCDVAQAELARRAGLADVHLFK